jgi:hypothetical protein
LIQSLKSTIFAGRKLLIVTKHHKEKVIATILEEALGVTCIVSDGFDTDSLGTFSGEVERKDDPIVTARNKCLRAMELYGCDLAVSSEGSFGPHPSIFFVPCDDEIILFMDKKNDLEIIARELSTETNFHGEEIKTKEQLNDLAERVKFPTHGLIVRKAKGDSTEIIKGIGDWKHLSTIFSQFIDKYGTVFVETDMRAMYNPTRMKVIEKATQKLADKIKSCCPQCSVPGFGVTDVKRGLPCGLCDYPTRTILSLIYTCQNCSFCKEEKYPHKKTSEEPMYCDMCNP